MQTFFKDGVERDPQPSARRRFSAAVCTVGCAPGPADLPAARRRAGQPPGADYLLKDMLENDRKPTKDVVEHLDRCLSCLACTTTCPSAWTTCTLIDHGRQVIERDYQRPLPERLYRSFLARVLPRPGLFRWLLRLAPLGHGCARCCPRRSKPRSRSAPTGCRPRPDRPTRVHAPAPVNASRTRGRVALFPGCAQQVLEPEINASTIRLLTRLGYEVEGAGDFMLRGADPPYGQG